MSPPFALKETKLPHFCLATQACLLDLVVHRDNRAGTKTDTQKLNYCCQQSIRTGRKGRPVMALMFRLIFPPMMPLSSKLLPPSPHSFCPRHPQQNANAEYGSNSLFKQPQIRYFTLLICRNTSGKQKIQTLNRQVNTLLHSSSLKDLFFLPPYYQDSF